MALAGLGAPSAFAATAPDQSVSGAATGAIAIMAGQTPGQTFTPSVSGEMPELSVLLVYADAGTQPAVTVSVYDTAAGFPTGSALATQAVTGIPINVDPNADWPEMCAVSPTLVAFDSPPTLLAGHQYAFVLSTGSGDFSPAACRSATASYAGGNTIVSSPPVPTWFNVSPASQLLFTTFAQASTPSADEVPAVIHQGMPMPAGGECADVDDDAVAYGTGLHGGWQRGWEPWVAPGGGWACIRTLTIAHGSTWVIDTSRG